MNRLTFLKSIIFLPLASSGGAIADQTKPPSAIADTMRQKADDVEVAESATLTLDVESIDGTDAGIYDLHVRWQGEVDASTLPRPVPPAPPVEEE